MAAKLAFLAFTACALALAHPAAAQRNVASPRSSGASGAAQRTAVTAEASPLAAPLFDLRESDFKFSLESLMRTLRDGRHEGWVLAAYPDPKTKRPLVGAGFSLDLEAREHPQRDPLNPHPFVEPSSAQLWQAAGLKPERLASILAKYEANFKRWNASRFRRKMAAHMLSPDVTEEEAMRLLRISAVQAVANARAYCRGFDSLSGPQQMALSQLVFQLGVNLEEFTGFLGALNAVAASGPDTAASLPGAESWTTVQKSLVQSQWARLYRVRAASVIAMFDPAYAEDPAGALERVDATLRPVRRPGRARSVRTVAYRKRASRAIHAKIAHPMRKPKAR